MFTGLVEEKGILKEKIPTATQQKELKKLLAANSDDKIEKILQIFRDCKVDEWALQLKNKYLDEAFTLQKKRAAQRAGSFPD